MADSLTPEHRSWNMSRIRSRDTKPERIARSLLHGMGYRFTVNGPKNRLLPGKPDIVLPKYRTVVFVHGCFWHRHKGCKDATTPKTRTEWWEAKFAGNVERDRRNQRALKKSGWRVMVIWECALDSQAALDALERRLPKLLGCSGNAQASGPSVDSGQAARSTRVQKPARRSGVATDTGRHVD